MRNTLATQLIFDLSHPGRRGAVFPKSDVPERPLQLVFGGSDGKTLFIAGRTSLYAVRTRFGSR